MTDMVHSIAHHPDDQRMARLGDRLINGICKHPVQSVISIIVLCMLAVVGYHLLDWAFVQAIWHSADGSACRDPAAGACWAVISERWRIIIFGLYPYQEQWRSAAACLILLGVGGLSCLKPFWTVGRILALWLAGFGCFITLISGGIFGLSFIPTKQWGGLALTLFVFASVCLLTIPMSLTLLFLRQSKLPLVAGPTRFIIDVVRSLPLLVVLFIAGVLLPFGLPDFLVGEKLYRVIVAFALYVSRYEAEVLRGGILGLSRGQEEAGKALGLKYWHRMRYIVLPQAFKLTLPSTINQIVILFLETPLIVVIGFFDVLASGAAAFGTAEWGIAANEVYIFIGLIFFTFSFGLSRFGASLERRLARSERT